MTTLLCQAQVMMQGLLHSRNNPKASPRTGNDKFSLPSPPKSPSADHDAGLSPFNLFASVPPVPWEADRRYSSFLDTRIPIRKGMRHSSVRRVSTSLSSRTRPPRPSLETKKSSHSKLDSPVGIEVNSFSKIVEKQVGMDPGRKDMESSASPRVLVPKSSKFGSQIASKEMPIDSRMPGLGHYVEGEDSVEFDLSDSDVEEDDEEHVFRDFSKAKHDVPSGLDALSASTISPSARGSMIRPLEESLGASEGNGDQSGHKIPSWHKHNYPALPFDFQFSYSETPNAPILDYREPAFSPFGPRSMKKPWLGLAPPNPSKKKVPPFDSFNPPPPQGLKGVKHVQPPGPFPEGQGPKAAKTREEIMGDPLTKEEIVYLVEKCNHESRQINLGRDGLTHNMLDSIHCHWKRRRVCRIKCKGVPTVDMDNVKFHVEEKTGGKIIYQDGGVLYLFRGRNYNYKDRPVIPLMLWKPATPVYPKLIERVPEGLTEEEVITLRKLGKKVEPICKLSKNGVYSNLVKNVRTAFEVDNLVRINCQGLKPSDYKKIGAKLKNLVPCVLLSFYKDHILMWKGREVHPDDLSTVPLADGESLDSSVKEVASTSACDLLDCMTREETEGMPRSKPEDNTGGQIVLRQEGGIDGQLDDTYWEQSMFPRLDVKEEHLLHLSMNERESDVLVDGWSHGRAINEKVLPVGRNEEVVPMTTLSSDLCVDEIGSNLISSIKVGSDKQGIDEAVPVDSDGELVAVSEILACETGSTLDTVTDVVTIAQVSHDEEVLPEDADEEAALMVAVASDISEYESESNLNMFVSDDQVIDQMHDEITTDKADCVRCVDALWDHALSSGMALEVDETDMDRDIIVRKAALLAQSCPLGPAYTHKLKHKLQVRKNVKLTPDEDIRRHLNRVSTVKKPKKVVKQRFQLPIINVPGMGGLPVDNLAKMLAIK